MEPEQIGTKGNQTVHAQMRGYLIVLPFIVGACYGLLSRLIFSGYRTPGIKIPDVMSAAFAVLVPIAIGAITVYLAESLQRRNYKYYFFAPWLSVAIFVAGTALALLEGAICIAMALPLFLLLGSFGGVVMGVTCRYRDKPKRTVQSIALLPLVFALFETGSQPGDQFVEIRRSVDIGAPAAVIWQLVNYPTNIQPSELAGGLAYKIGVPYPIEARTVQTGVGGKRQLLWQRGVNFEEEITAWQENRHIAWKYLFSEDSFPPGSMDDHVVIGGQYFDLVDTSYTLSPLSAGTRLEITVKFRVSTAFNWYARPVARFLIADTAEAILNFYKVRAEKENRG